jgi:uncharacterized protein YaiI (UPF0178 family)|tara:strand:- start:11 stop:517 length:507 start_codon:yes stop_codon:yes gene_type:complete
MKIWIDADAAPNDVKIIVAKAALRLKVETALVANQRLQIPANNPFVSSVRVEGGPDVADDHIAEHAEPGDLAITADIPLAARLVEKDVSTIDPRGTEYTRENIGERLSVRDFMDQLRSTGVETGGPQAWNPQNKQAFASTFDRVLTKLMRAAQKKVAKKGPTDLSSGP